IGARHSARRYASCSRTRAARNTSESFDESSCGGTSFGPHDGVSGSTVPLSSSSTADASSKSRRRASPVRPSSASRARPSDRSGTCLIARASYEERKRSEEHTSELQSLAYLVCRLLLE